jgi:hypothetical protein
MREAICSTRSSWLGVLMRRPAVVVLGALLIAASTLASGVPARALPSHHEAAGPPWPGLGLGAPAEAHELAHPLRAPKPGSSSVLYAVFCLSPASCWGVGYYEKNGARLNQVQHWNGRKWSQTPVASPAGTHIGDTNELLGVRCIAAASCWAVGYYERHKIAQDEALHWNGKKWSLTATPNPGGTLSGDFNSLSDVACTSPGNCWAAGQYGNSGIDGEAIANQALHWNGKKWSHVTTPNPAGDLSGHENVLDSVRCASARNCWAVGTYGSLTGGTENFSNEVLHWNGSKWSRVSAPNPAGTAGNDFNELQGLSCTSAADCWAVGAYGAAGTSFNEILHWNGKKWTRFPGLQAASLGTSALGADETLTAVSCTSPKSCWAVGYYSGGMDFNQALSWNGTVWLPVKMPQPGGTTGGGINILNGVRCTSATNCWAVGTQAKSGESQVNEILHLRGTKWFNG